MKSSKAEYVIFAIAMVFIFYSGNLDQNTRILVTGLLIGVIIINQVFFSKKKGKKEDE